ncbi:hypothetical protein HG263_13535 [Pseudoalteromonas sp. JBTF-M23]|uniref:Uncharacterized protein n=1 Tax=Pseudoalteromonas caenipelagi TaxID=2726988 RepID=A0A849VDT1_9GAMM|nr:hypothetical protein [Pseudoalteromonas caenipelagi]NOU51552.1 hypothetical protein [Pseudoalteromonas caenipelagi]
MRGLVVIIVMLLAFALGIIVERLWLSEQLVAAYNFSRSADLKIVKENTIEQSAQSQVQLNAIPQQHQQSSVVEQLTQARLEISRLEAENEQLQQRLYEHKQSTQLPPVNVPNGDLKSMLAQQYQQESRDAVWADEVELQINDFLYQNDLSHLVKLQEYGCKSTVCQMELVPQGDAKDFDEALWRKVSEKLFSQTWFKRFTMSTSTSTQDKMVVHLSKQQVYDQ